MMSRKIIATDIRIIQNTGVHCMDKIYKFLNGAVGGTYSYGSVVKC